MADIHNPDPATQPETNALPISSLMAQESSGLVVVWAPGDPGLVGAWLPLSSEPKVLGRGPAQSTDPAPRVQAIRQSPGANVLLEPFASPALSRVQLELSQIEDGARLQLENLGRCKLTVNDLPCAEALVEPGDIVQVGNQLLLLCVRRVARMTGQFSQQHRFGEPDEHGFVGESPAIWLLRQELGFVSARPGHVLIHGESGTGKELAANAVHRASKRPGPLISRNAATFPDTLIEAELFGCAKGFPNPGMPERIGLIGAAHTGTLFLDEFAELPLAQQTRLLRVLDAGEYQSLGEATLRRADVRVVGATNRALDDLRADVAARFAFLLRMPNLASRVEDIPLIVRHLLKQVAREDAELRARFFQSDDEPRLSADLLLGLLRGPAIGNVRWLRNTLWRSLAESSGDTLHWPNSLPGQVTRASNPPPPPASGEEAASEPERERIRQVLERNQGSVDKTWRELGLSSRFALSRLLKKHGITLRRRTS
ncbi:MAG TPA: sigma 54-interacting transcriptional regulator [Polyangiaceae bacterium]|nr:sigma 54-interacting transcriptional regulator [Polyangiaceae bacterium]